MKCTGLSLAAMAWFSVASAYAQQTAPTIGTADAMQADAGQAIATVTVTARRFHMEPAEFKDYEYSYNLSNGEVVRFSRKVGRFYASFHGQPNVEIFPTAADQFMTRDGARLRFTEDGDKLSIDHFELLARAAGMPIAAVARAPK